MAKVDDDKVWVTISGTVNLGNFESAKLEVGYNKTYGKEEPMELIEKITDELETFLSVKTDLLKKHSKLAKKTKKRKKKKVT